MGKGQSGSFAAAVQECLRYNHFHNNKRRRRGCTPYLKSHVCARREEMTPGRSQCDMFTSFRLFAGNSTRKARQLRYADVT
jgi:hypothetical protein